MNKHALQLTLIFLASTLIWFLGPIINIHGHTLLEGEMSRIFLILLIILIVSVNNVILYLRDYLASLPNKALNERELQTLPALKQQIRNVLHYCRSLHQGWHTWFSRWFISSNAWLVIGPKSAGKTTLLLQSGISIQTTIPPLPESPALPNHDELLEELSSFKLDDIPQCHWHVTEQGLFIDTPGEFMMGTIEPKAASIWVNFLQLLKRYRFRIKLKGIILVLNFSEITQHQKHSKYLIQLLQQRLLEIRQHLGKKLPLRIVFSQCDLVNGFQEYFSSLHSQEREQPLGFQFTSLAYTDSLTQEFNQKFSALLQHFNAWLTSRLHQEHNAHKKLLIHDFPLQMGSFQESLGKIVYHLIEQTHHAGALLPQGLYFTSATQQRAPIDNIAEVLHDTLNFPTTPLQFSPLWPTPKSFFSKHLLTTLLNPNSHNASTKSSWLKDRHYHPRTYRLTLFSTASLVFLGTGFIIYVFSNDLITLYQTQRAISNYKSLLLNPTQSNADLQQSLLKALQHQIQRYEQIRVHWLQNPKLTNLTARNAKPTIRSLSIKEVTQRITHNLEHQLAATHLLPEQIYGALKIYRMLAHPNERDINFVTTWLKLYITDADVLRNLQPFLAQLNKQSSLLSEDPNLVNLAQNHLNGLPTAVLAYAVLKNYTTDNFTQQLSLFGNVQNAQNIFTFDPERPYILPYFYTATGFQSVFLSHYVEALKTAILGNTVLGTKHIQQVDLIVKQATPALFILYFNDYLDWWEKTLINIKVNKIDSLTNAQNIIQALVAEHSPLNTFIQTMTAQSLPMALLAQKIGGFIPTNTLLQHALERYRTTALYRYSQIQLNNDYSQHIISTLKQLNHELTQINQAPDTAKAAFMFATRVMKNEVNPLTGLFKDGDKSVYPIQTLLSSIGQTVLTLVLQNTRDYLNHEWRANVWPQYENTLENRYPFFKNSSEDVNLIDFSHFFGPQGALTEFFKMVKPFIDSTHTQWRWKVVHGLSLNFSNSVLQMFERARIINRMFFTNNNSLPRAQFSLQQIAMMPIVKTFKLSFNGQSMTEAQGSQTVHDFVWPGDTGEENGILEISSLNGQLLTSAENGLWAWFRLLDKATLVPSNDLKRYQVKFNVNGTEIEYQLVAKDEINPYIPGIISQFRCISLLG